MILKSAFRILAATLLSAIVIAPLPSFAWGGDGHRIICAVAWDELKPPVRSQVEVLLNVHTREAFAEECNWADVYRRTHSETSPWHFVNVPPGAKSVDLKRDCAGTEGCATSQVELRLTQLRSRDPGVDKTAALRVLLHALGDEHQPLHVTPENGDKGGNAIKGHFMGREISMHAVLDSALLSKDGRPWQEIASDLERRVTARQRRQWTRGKRVSWADESLALSLDPRTGYVGLTDGFELGADYERAMLPVVFDRLSRAALRLGKLINEGLQ